MQQRVLVCHGRFLLKFLHILNAPFSLCSRCLATMVTTFTPARIRGRRFGFGETEMKKTLAAVLAAATIAGAAVSSSTSAEARWRGGGAVAAGVIGGIAAGALIAGAARANPITGRDRAITAMDQHRCIMAAARHTTGRHAPGSGSVSGMVMAGASAASAFATNRRWPIAAGPRLDEESPALQRGFCIWTLVNVRLTTRVAELP